MPLNGLETPITEMARLRVTASSAALPSGVLAAWIALSHCTYLTQWLTYDMPESRNRTSDRNVRLIERFARYYPERGFPARLGGTQAERDPHGLVLSCSNREPGSLDLKNSTSKTSCPPTPSHRYIKARLAALSTSRWYSPHRR
jgi:hypothetical protein